MKKLAAILSFMTIFFCGCDEIKETLNMINCKYKINNIGNISWAGINLTNITSLSDLSVSDALAAANAIRENNYNINFDLNVLALNETESNAKIRGFDYKLLLNENEVTNGEHGDEVTVEANGGSAILPVNMNFDAKDLIEGGTVNDMVNLVLNLVNYGNGESSDVAVKFSPWIPVGNSVQKMPYITLNHTLQ